MSEWPTPTVLELQREGILLVEDGNHGEYRPRPGEFVENGVAYVRAADMEGGRVLFSSAAKINDVARKRITKGIGQRGDVLLSHKGTVGKVALVEKDAPPFVCSPQTTFWRTLDERRLDRHFLFGFLRSPVFHSQLATRAGETDMAPYVSLTSQRGLTVTLPPPSEQQAIGRILGALEERIEVARSVGNTVEEIARGLFQSWFVDFDPVHAKSEGRGSGLPAATEALFPSRFESSPLGDVPQGWNVLELGRLAELEKGLSYTGDGLVDECGLPLVNLGCFQGGGRFRIDKIKRYTGEYRERHLVRPGDLVIANTDVTQDRVILGSPALVPAGESTYLFSHHVYAARFKAGWEQWRLFVYYSLLRPEFRVIAEGYATGTTVLALPRDGVLNFQVVVPSDDAHAGFCRIAEPLLERASASRLEAQLLTTIRDQLLPRLISGEISVKDAERLVI